MFETSRYLRSVLVLTSLLALTQCQYEGESSDQEAPSTGKHYNTDIGRLLFKNMRFRDLPEMAESYESPEYSSYDRDELNTNSHPWQRKSDTFLRILRGQAPKRQGQSSLVNNLTAILSSINRPKSSPESMRMPSLRFG